MLVLKPIKSSIQSEEQVTYVEDTLFRKDTLETGSGRYGVWRSAWRLVAKRPLLGHGFGVTEELFMRGYFEEIPVEFQGGHVHNSFLEELVNQGYLGASMMFFALLCCHFWGLRFLTRFNRYPEDTFKLGVTLYACVCAGTISAFFESWLSSVGNVMCIPFWLCITLFYKVQADIPAKSENIRLAV